MSLIFTSKENAMLKIVANVSKKVPVPGIDYSSQSYSAGVEVEVADAASPQEIQSKVHEIYGLLEQTIDSEISGQQAVITPPQPPVNRIAGQGRPTQHSGNGRHATEAQVKAVFAISKALGMNRESLFDLLYREYHTSQVESLSIKAASKLIEQLKSMQA
jgi:hypothetical protein